MVRRKADGVADPLESVGAEAVEELLVMRGVVREVDVVNGADCGVVRAADACALRKAACTNCCCCCN